MTDVEMKIKAFELAHGESAYTSPDIVLDMAKKIYEWLKEDNQQAAKP